MAKQNSKQGKKRGRDDSNGFEQWGGYMGAKLTKLDNQFEQEGGKSSGLFSGIAIFVNGYTEPSGEELKRIMISNGGTFHHYFSRRRTTHIIAANLPHTKVRNMDTSRIVKAAWIVDSLSAGRVLDYSNYLLYTRQNSKQPMLLFPKVENPQQSNSANLKEQPVPFDLRNTIATSLDDNKPCQKVDFGIALNTGHSGTDDVKDPEQSGKPSMSLSKNNFSTIIPESDEELWVDSDTNDNGSQQDNDSPQIVISSLTPRKEISKDLILAQDTGEGSHASNSVPELNESKMDTSTKRACDGTAVQAKQVFTSSLAVLESSCDKMLDIGPAAEVALNPHLVQKSANKTEDNSPSKLSTTRTISPLMFSSSGSSSGTQQSRRGSQDLLFSSSESSALDNCLTASGEVTKKLSSVGSVLLNTGETKCKTETFSVLGDITLKHEKDFQFKSLTLGNNSNTSNTSNPNFLSEFYNNSRLHHISTMGAMFKDYVTQLLLKPLDQSGKRRFMEWRGNNISITEADINKKSENKIEEVMRNSNTYAANVHRVGCSNKEINNVSVNGAPASIKSTPAHERVVMHIDMDCFFVSVGLRKRPDLVGKPVAVTHARGNSSSRRAGADPQVEFDLYTNRRREKNLKKKCGVSSLLEKGDRMLGKKDRTDDGLVIVKNNEMDEGFDDWDLNEEEEKTLQHLMDAVDPVSGNDTETLSGDQPYQSSTETLQKETVGLGVTLTNRTVEGAASNAGSPHSGETIPRGDLQGPTSKPGTKVVDELSEGKLPGKTGRLLLDSSSSLSEVASCSYEARQAGVSNGMFLGAALKLCPDIQTIPYDFDGYKEVAYKLYDIVASYSRQIEAVSCDELYADVTSLLKEVPEATPLQLAHCLRDQVTEATGCGCSAGLGPNKLAARLATKLAKPHGHAHLDSAALQQHLKDLPVRELPGVGGSTSARLRGVGVEVCGQLLALGKPRLAAVVGPRTATALLQAARGRDDRPVTPHHVRKSVSAEVNYGIRFSSEADVERFVRQVCGEVAQRLRAVALQGRCVTLKLKVRAKDAPVETAKFMGHGVCDNIAKSVSLARCTDSEQIIFREVMTLVKQLKVPPPDYRGVGVQVSRLNNEVAAGGLGKACSAITKFLVKEDCNNLKRMDWEGLNNLAAVDTLQNGEPIRQNNMVTKLVKAKNEPKNMEKYVQKRVPCDTNSNVSSRSETKVLDIEVLNALPDDLKEQIIAEYKQQGYTIPSNNNSLETSIRAPSKATNDATSTSRHLPIMKAAIMSENEPRPGPSCSKPQPGISGYEPQPGTSGYEPQPGTSGYEPQPGPSGYEPQPKTSGYVPQSGPSGYQQGPPMDQVFEDGQSPEHLVERGRDSDVTTTKEDLNASSDADDDPMITSYSQVDNSFLSALPDEIKEELRRDFHRQKNVINSLRNSPKKAPDITSPAKGAPSNTSPIKLPSTNGGTLVTLQYHSPRKGTSPRKPLVNAGQGRGRRRGRPSKHDPRRNSTRGVVPVLASNGGAGARGRGRQQGGRRVQGLDTEEQLFSDRCIRSPEPMSDATSPGTVRPATEDEGRQQQMPSLCGETSLVAVKDLVREWVKSCQSPDTEDATILAAYFTSLAQHGDLETLDTLLKFLFRVVSRRPADGQSAWRAVYCSLLVEVQRAMVRLYNAPLKVKHFAECS